MKIVRVIAVTSICLGLSSFGMGQTKVTREFSPAEKGVLDSYGKQIMVAKGLLHDGKAAAALSEATAAIAKLQSLKPIDIPGDYYVVAQCHMALGQLPQALADFKKCFVWDTTKKDLWPRIGDWAGCAADYAIALSQSGQINEAKSIYYYALRNLNPYGERSWEPYPFVVVFDASEGGDVWRYTPERFKAACLMLKSIAAGGGDDLFKWVDEAAKLAPTWMYPPLYRGFVRAGNHPEMDFDRARSLTASQESRSLVTLVASYNREHMPASAPNPKEARAKLIILETSKELLARTHADLVDKA